MSRCLICPVNIQGWKGAVPGFLELRSNCRTLLIASWFPPIVGGASVVYDNLCQHLRSQLSVLAPRRLCSDRSVIKGCSDYDAQSPSLIDRVDYLRYPQISPARNTVESIYRVLAQDLPFRRELWKHFVGLVERDHPDVICIGDFYALSWLALRVRDRLELPVIFYVHGEEVTNESTSRIWKWETTRAVRTASGFVVPSSFTKTELALRGVPADLIRVIYNGVDATRFAPGEKDPELSALHGADGRKVLLTVARLEERKGIDRMIQAMPAIIEKVPEALYLIVGAGPLRSSLEELRDSLGLKETVRFCGSPQYGDSSTIVRYYQTCDLFVMPNRTLASGDTEGFGLVFLEANACGKPVVGGNAGGVPDAVAHGETGFLVDPHSVDDIAGATLRLLLDPQLAASFGAAGRKRAESSQWARRAEEFRSFVAGIADPN